MSHDNLGWLRLLIVRFEQSHDWRNDEDAAATRDMLAACRTLANDLGEWLPPDEPPDVATLPVGDDSEFPY